MFPLISLVWSLHLTTLPTTSPTPSELAHHRHHIADRGLNDTQLLVDTNTTSDSSLVPLTADLLTHYIGLEQKLQAFWKEHKTLEDSVKAHTHKQPVFLGPPLNVTIAGFIYDYPKLVTQEPTLKSIFEHAKIAPSQYKALALTITKAVYDAEVTKEMGQVSAGSGMTLSGVDSNTVAGKNATLAQSHRPELAAIGTDFSFGLSGMQITPNTH